MHFHLSSSSMVTFWMVPPQDEVPVPFDSNPHPVNGVVQGGNPNVPQGWQHDLHGAAQQVQIDHGLNDVQMADVTQDLQEPLDEDLAEDEWDDWPEVNLQDVVDQNHLIQEDTTARVHIF